MSLRLTLDSEMEPCDMIQRFYGNCLPVKIIESPQNNYWYITAIGK